MVYCCSVFFLPFQGTSGLSEMYLPVLPQGTAYQLGALLAVESGIINTLDGIFEVLY